MRVYLLWRQILEREQLQQVFKMIYYCYSSSAAQTRSHSHAHRQNYNMAKLISCTLSLSRPLFNKASFFIQIHNIYTWGSSVALLSCSRLFYFARSEKWACAPRLLFTAPAPLAGDLHSIFFKAMVIKNNAKAPPLALASGKKTLRESCAFEISSTFEKDGRMEKVVKSWFAWQQKMCFSIMIGV